MAEDHIPSPAEVTARRVGDALSNASREAAAPEADRGEEVARRLAEQMVRRTLRGPSLATRHRWALPMAVAAVTLVSTVGGLWWATAGRYPLRLLRRPTPAPAFGIFGQGDPRVGHLRQRYQAPPAGELALRFAAGARLVLASGSSLVVLETGATKHRLRLVEGSMRVSIPPGGSTRWILHAGRFRVQVTGTEFTLRYRGGAAARLDVTLTRGAVQVHGPSLPPAGVRVAPGFPLRRRRREASWRRWTADADPGESGAPLAPPPAPDTPQRPPVTPNQAAPAPTPRAAPGLLDADAWARWYDGGRYRQLLADARRRGLTRMLGTLDGRSLWLLAQSARYAGAPRLALRALGQLRRRFARTRRAREASYIMARIHADRLRQPRTACDLFARYLTESPRGVLREEALGRRIAACRAAGRSVEARRAARLYMKSYPRGIFRGLARRALGGTATP